ncbi:MAG: hypothetical protein PHE93_00965 [Clostridia bacterium]|nr:hypothetical protein [Clostridia bacterium]
MWSCEISIDKEFAREFNYLESRIKQCKNLSFALEESKERNFIYIATLCDNREEVQKLIEEAICEVYLTYLKLSFFLDKIEYATLSHSLVALLSSLVFFDRSFEESVIMKTIHEVASYNIDGILNFRLKSLTTNWTELSGLANNLLKVATTPDDIFNVATFLASSEGGKNQLLFVKNTDLSVFNTTENRTVQIENIFDEPELDLILATVRECPSEIILRNVDFSDPMQNTLRKLAHVQIEK